ncbi:sensor histidine kinase [Marinobacterium jannaschii]|uniref:sensor histidine kinase n=1 Tax=Marinobacterium jannaschii TaxID=64970 RepID=UPI0004897D26|nr:PAS domain-containing sensor histidine kinase [Marinobacterium jannaschii]
MANTQDPTARIAVLEQQIERLQREVETERERCNGEVAQAARITHQMRQLLELLPGGIILIDGDGRVADCNPEAEALLGESLRQRPWGEVISACFAPRTDDGHEVSLKNGRRVSLATRAMQDQPGQILLLTDQTETRLLQERLSHYQRLSGMGQMMASLAHQIRTPLSAALLYSDHIARPDIQPDKRAKFAGKIKSRLSQLEQQVRDMLVFARGEIRLDDEITTDELMRDLEDQLDVPLASYDADCECINELPGALLRCNKESLTGVVLNLVNNALQACGQEADIELHFTSQDGNLRICVHDHGPGMDEETRRRAMEPFFTTKTHGTGLGLAVAQVVAVAHGGRFELITAAGEGTRAAIVLPLRG